MSEILDALSDYGPQIRDGLSVTLQLSLGGAVLAFIVAVILGLAAISGHAVPRTISRIIVEFFRGTSLVVQLFFIYYVFPGFGLELDAITCGVIALGLNYGAYGSEVVRGSLNAVPKGQWETATALSMPWVTKVRRIIWPQAWALMLPGLNNLMIMLIKGTAIAFLIGLHDLTYATNEMRKDGVEVMAAYTIGFVIYYLISLVFYGLLRVLERRAQRRLGITVTTSDPAQTAGAAATAGAVA
ncbi:amino acid ABC transporter permease [Solicola gregarius]|uniref:Amino acid ABC transporter permease n=1 Tax=Solicola gregarius TaxID=2908642 RepID=A0AA46YIY4_9ACTN|nr:amino acid ABC transporter permease [Solicola gregarius]UYM03780.1 amino acid ABC transporter permease [Solicola gregarius]